MPITELPVLPAEYPLFDWADWPKSRAALVPGGPTKEFEKACWNAIVDYMAEAVEASGLQWRDGTQDPEYIQMFGDGNIRLKAQHMNILMRAVDDVIRIPWRWEYDTDFRGYIGRQFFHFDINMEKDVVYPEYFTELVAHINKVVEILRGTSQINYFDSDWLARSNSRIRIEKKGAATARIPKIAGSTKIRIDSESVTLGELIDFPKHISSIQVSGPVWLSGGTISKRIQSKTGIRVSGSHINASPITPKIKMNSLQSVALDYERNVLETAASILFHSISGASIVNAATINTDSETKTRTSVAAVISKIGMREFWSNPVQSYFTVKSPEMDQVEAQDTNEYEHLSKTYLNASAEISESIPITVNGYSKSLNSAEAVHIRSMPISAEIGTKSKENVTLNKSRSAPVKKSHNSKITAETPILKYTSGPIFTEKSAKTKMQCALDVFGWDYPVWVDGGLWIRQAYSITPKENGELEVR